MTEPHDMVSGDDVDRTVLDDLDRDECLRLLRTVPVGRIAVGNPGQAPLVMPVNFGLDGDIVVFRSDEGDKLGGMRKWPVTFQVDAFDPDLRTGWSVMIHGIATDATTEQSERVAVHPWSPGIKQWWVQILPALITGRRIRPIDTPSDRRGNQ